MTKKIKRSSSKGALIKGMSKRLPRIILENSVFPETLKRNHEGICWYLRALLQEGAVPCLIDQEFIRTNKLASKGQARTKMGSVYHFQNKEDSVSERHRNIRYWTD